MQPFSAHFARLGAAGTLLDDRHVLAFIEFDETPAPSNSDPRCIGVGLPQLGQDRLVEVWTSESPVESGRRGRISYSTNDQVLVGHLAVDEQDFADLESATRTAYAEFLPFAREMGFPHYLRIWNYIPDINGDENGVERYKRFCVGRHARLAEEAFPEHKLPAASGVGSMPGPMLIYFLAARAPGTQVENPRQVSAFHYPPRYGPRSPAFSRAMVKDWGDVRHLYISGTASIVGHQSLHGDELLAQLDESMRNMNALIESARDRHGLPIHTLTDLTQIKVYVRHPENHEAVRAHVDERLGGQAPIIYLHGELCRTDLLVEIEGIFAG